MTKALPALLTLAVSAVASAEPAGFSVSIKEAVQTALALQPDVAQAALDVSIARADVGRASSLFVPILTAEAFIRRESYYVDNGSDPDGVTTGITARVELGVTGRTGYGGTYSLVSRGQRTSGNSYVNTLTTQFDTVFGPEFQAVIAARFTQPLLRNAGSTANKGLVERAELATEVAADQLRVRREQLALDVVAAYWTLVVRREEVSIRESSLAEAKSLYDLVSRRIKGGQSPRSDAVQADVTVAERQQAVRQASLAVIEAERSLLALTRLNKGGKFRMVDVLVPTDKPSALPAKVSFEEELAVAMKHRPDLRRNERELALARLNHKIATNGARPRLDLYVEGGIAGIGIDREPDAIIPDRLLGSVGNAASTLFSATAPYVEVGLSFELPFSNRAARGLEEQAKLRIDRVIAQDVQSDVELDVRGAVQVLEVSRSRLTGAEIGEKLATENVEAQRKLYVGGSATVFDTLRAQAELANARSERLLAAADQEVAYVRLLATRGTLLDHFGVTTAR